MYIFKVETSSKFEIFKCFFSERGLGVPYDVMTTQNNLIFTFLSIYNPKIVDFDYNKEYF